MGNRRLRERMQAVKLFFLKLFIIIGLFLISVIAFAVNPHAGLIIGLVLLIIPGFAVIWPIPALGLASRGFNFSIAFFVGLTATMGSFGDLDTISKAELKELRDKDSQAYLEKIRNDENLWLKELKELAPERYAVELTRLEAQRKAEEREAARRKVETEAAERAKIEQRRAATERRRAEQAAAREKATAKKREAYVEKLRRELEGLRTFDASEYTDSQTGLTLALALFSVWATICEEGADLRLSDEEEAIRRTFKTLAEQSQMKALPVLRNAYGPIMREELWVHDASARTFGNRFSTVEFVSVLFAANRNIKQFQETVGDTLHMLRFKQVQYKWFKGASEYTYYDMESLPDDALVIWKDNGRYRIVD